jgi:hypothetical protein
VSDGKMWIMPLRSEPLAQDGSTLHYATPDGVGQVDALGVESFTIQIDTEPFDRAMRKTAEAIGRFTRMMQPYAHLLRKFERRQAVAERRRRQQLRHRDQRAARRARRQAQRGN